MTDRVQDDVDERSEADCEMARLQAAIRLATIETCYKAFLEGASHEHSSLIATLLDEEFTHRQVFNAIVRLRNAA